MKRYNWITVVLTALMLNMAVTTVAMASPLTAPKAEGLIGEQADGYIGFVSSNVPADVRRLVNETNAKRKAGYQRIAQKQGANLVDVEKVGGNTAIEKTLRGNYIRDADGVWRKK